MVKSVFMFMFMAVGFVSGVASADTVKTGINTSIRHGCARESADKALSEFIKKDPTFWFDNKNHKASMTQTTPTKDGKGSLEQTWSSDSYDSCISKASSRSEEESKCVRVVWIDINKAEWFLPANKEKHVQVHLLIDAGPFVTPTVQVGNAKTDSNPSTRAKPRIVVDLIQDYEPEDTASGMYSRIDRCVESWFGSAVWL